MSGNDDLTEAIRASRSESDRNSTVIYDLTNGIDFSNPKKTAEALATVFFEEDGMKWFKVSGDHIDFQPEYKVRIILAKEHHKLMEETVDDFLQDLEKEEISSSFSPEIRDNAVRASRLGTVIAIGAIRSAVFRHSEEKIYKEYIRDDLFIDLLQKLEIRTPDNEDLMDWTNLPL